MVCSRAAYKPRALRAEGVSGTPQRGSDGPRRAPGAPPGGPLESLRRALAGAAVCPFFRYTRYRVNVNKRRKLPLKEFNTCIILPDGIHRRYSRREPERIP